LLPFFKKQPQGIFEEVHRCLIPSSLVSFLPAVWQQKMGKQSRSCLPLLSQDSTTKPNTLVTTGTSKARYDYPLTLQSQNQNLFNQVNMKQLVLQSLVESIIPLFPGLVIANVAPGFVYSPLYRDSALPVRMAAKLFGRSTEEGARNVSMALLSLEKSTQVSSF
jgi:hypothetical protein